MVGTVPLYAYLALRHFLKDFLFASVRDRINKMSLSSGPARSFLCIDSMLKGLSLMGNKLIILSSDHSVSNFINFLQQN